MPQPHAAAVAFFALGASFLGTALLLLFNPRSRGIRWYALFWVAIMTWLAAQGWGIATGRYAEVRPVISIAVHLMPALFLAFALVEALGRPSFYPVAAVGLGLALLPLDIASWQRDFAEEVLLAWNVVPWVVATALLVGHSFRELRGERPAHRRRLGWLVVLGMAGVLPIGLIGGILTRGEVHVYVLPLLMVWIQLLSFVGVTYFRFYEIEVRAARSGELAAGAAEAERLAVLGELTASLAHEIRNPLTGVRSLAQRLAEEEIDPVRRQRYAGVILEEVGRVERLVSNLLGLARRAPRPHPTAAATALAPLFDDLLLLVGARAERAGVRLAADAEGLTAPAAREPIAQALLNLLLNAIHHTPRAGLVQLLARATAGGLELAVRDSGPGVAPAERQRIWEPFVSGRGGTGLGLAVVRRLAHEQGWDVEVGDAPGGGAEFRLRIGSPAATAAGLAPRLPSAADPPAPPQRGRGAAEPGVSAAGPADTRTRPA